MKGLKEIIAGTGFLISGALGVAIGNLEITLNTAGGYKHSVTYLLFMFFIIVGLIYTILGFLKKDD
ncbi:MAG TPA: hypothetical protein VIM70_15060 [Clostridium sp.]|uniref:hypothetical protein n=1 Tax=Clostridium sp. TaxID=1506 RepID=UPI002F95E426